VTLACAPLLLSGCQNFIGPISAFRAAYDPSLVKGPTKEEMADVSGAADAQNFMERWLTPRSAPVTSSKASSGSTHILGSDGWRPIAKPTPDPKADAQYDAAMARFKAGDLAAAETEFARIAKKRKGTPWGENSQYFLAETQFQRKKYVDAHDSFERLHADYPATDYLDKLVSREFEIAHIWFKQVDSKIPRDEVIPWQGRFDGRRPLIDTKGSALKALEHVRQNDPSGPLADRAAIEIADHYMKGHDYESAALYYDQFIADYPKSPLLQRAQHAAISARMNSFLGPEYDGSMLEKARGLVKKSMETFPEQQATMEGLYNTLDHINNAEAEKTYRDGMYYERIGKVTSAEYYLGKIPQRWPDSPWAVKAKAELAQLARLPRKPSKPSRIIIPPGASDPFFSAGPMGAMGMGMGPMGGMPMMGMSPGGMM
jgi:outer membrane protein assembly factor BamD (BamD/ComL family)